MAESQENSSDQARPSQRQGEEEDLGDRLRGLQMEDRPSLEGRALPRPHPTPKTLERAFQMARDLVTYITSDDPNLERGLRFKKSIDDALAPYREVYNKETHNGPKGFASSSHNSNLDAQSNSRYVANQARPLVPRLDFGSSTRRQERQNMTSSGGFPLPGAVAPSLGGDAARQRARQRPPPDALPNTAARERMKICQPMNSTGKLQLSNGVSFDFTAEDLQDRGEIGRGAFGAVNKMIHRDTNTVMAVKRIRSTVDEKEQKQLLMDLDVVMRSNGCPCIVQFYGALFKEGDCWICMELMDTSLDKFYKFIFERLNTRIPECIIAKITVDTVDALNYLKETLKIIHRDVKPSNILLDRRGKIKLCDFGISGKLVDSIAKTRDAGCRPYMAPERIDPQLARGYDVRSDVWSLGITLMEVATGRFPYPRWGSVFEQLTQVVQGDPPRLTSDNGNAFSQDFLDFVNTCLIKEEHCRPKYKALLEHPFIRSGMRESPDVAGYVSGILQEMDQQQWEHQ